MTTYVSYIICALLMIFSIKGSVQGSLEEESAEYSLKRLFYYFSIFVTFLIMIINLDKMYLVILKFASNYPSQILVNTSLFKALLLGIAFLFIQVIIYNILRILSNPLTRAYSLLLSKGKVRIFFISSIFGFLKGLVIILIMFMGIVTYNTTFGRNLKINLFNDVSGYSALKNIISINKPVMSYNDFKDYIPTNSNITIYYNGVTLEDGIKSTNEIDKKALEIVAGAKNDREKAKRLYSWIGSNIKYDFEKAERALGSQGVSNSGAIEAWNERAGICFDYACLYVAMGKSVGLGTRIVTGDAFDGENYGPHAWNQAYLADEGIWINVDPTFYLAGDYFDNNDFYDDHLNEQIAGEWD